MRSRVAISVLLLVGGCCSYTDSSSLLSETVGGKQRESHNELLQGVPRFVARVPLRRAKASAHSVALVVKWSVLLATLYLIVRCAGYISGVSHAPNRGGRRLAGKKSCHSEVSNEV